MTFLNRFVCSFKPTWQFFFHGKRRVISSHLILVCRILVYHNATGTPCSQDIDCSQRFAPLLSSSQGYWFHVFPHLLANPKVNHCSESGKRRVTKINGGRGLSRSTLYGNQNLRRHKAQPNPCNSSNKMESSSKCK